MRPRARPNRPRSTSTGPDVSRRIQPADLGIVTVDRQLGFERVDQIECAARQVNRTGRAGRQSDLEKGPHRRSMGPDQIRSAGMRVGAFRRRNFGSTQTQEIAAIHARSESFHARTRRFTGNGGKVIRIAPALLSRSHKLAIHLQYSRPFRREKRARRRKSPWLQSKAAAVTFCDLEWS